MAGKEEKLLALTPKQIADLKKQHGRCHLIEVDGYQLVLRQPKVVDTERALASDPKKKKPFNFQRSIIQNCKVYETPGTLADDERTMAIYAIVDEIVNVPDATVKEL